MSEPNYLTIKFRTDSSKSPPTFESFEIDSKHGNPSGSDSGPIKHNFECYNCHTGYVVVPKIIQEYPVPQSKDFTVSVNNSSRKSLNQTLGRVVCPDCDKIFSSKYYLTAHKLDMHTKSLQLCEICQRGNECTKAEYYAHIRRRHPTQIPNKATKAAKAFSGDKYSCIYCEQDVFFGTFEELKQHLDTIHARKYLCKICPKSFTSSDKLYRHKRTHQEASFACPICEKKFCSKQGMERHALTHQEKKLE